MHLPCFNVYHKLNVYYICVGDKQIEGTQTGTGNLVTSQIAFLLRPDDNEAAYRCNATNEATTEPLLTNIRMSVHCK